MDMGNGYRTTIYLSFKIIDTNVDTVILFLTYDVDVILMILFEIFNFIIIISHRFANILQQTAI